MPGKSRQKKTRKFALQNMAMEELMVLLIGLDQTAKSCVENMPAEDFPHPVSELDDKLIIYRNHNAGLPFGIFSDDRELTRWLPVAVTSLAAGSYIYLKSRNERRLLRLALAIIMSGSLSNIIDRFTRGYVVDYLNIGVGDLKKVVFNLGDICVITGFSMMSVIELARALGLSGK